MPNPAHLIHLFRRGRESESNIFFPIPFLTIFHVRSTSATKNILIRCDLLKPRKLAYLHPYGVLICENFQDGQVCRYGVPLKKLISHLSGGDRQLAPDSPRQPHHHTDLRNSKTAKKFLGDILARYPTYVRQKKSFMRSPWFRANKVLSRGYVPQQMPFDASSPTIWAFNVAFS